MCKKVLQSLTGGADSGDSEELEKRAANHQHGSTCVHLASGRERERKKYPREGSDKIVEKSKGNKALPMDASSRATIRGLSKKKKEMRP